MVEATRKKQAGSVMLWESVLMFRKVMLLGAVLWTAVFQYVQD
jgi:hypothetical protein